MAKGIKSLTGVDKDAYLERVHAAAKDAGEPVDEPMLARLKTEVTRVWVKAGALADAHRVITPDLGPRFLQLPRADVVLKQLDRVRLHPNRRFLSAQTLAVGKRPLRHQRRARGALSDQA